MDTESIKPIAGVPPSGWAAVDALPTVCQRAFLVTAGVMVPGFVSIAVITVRKINREGGYVVWRGPDLHRQEFDLDRIAEFADVHSTITRALGCAAALLKAQLDKIDAEKPQTLQP